jgi:hypothetical protein
VVDPRTLRQRFDAARQDTESLAPAEQVTFAAIEAWAARFSFHPSILQQQHRYKNPSGNLASELLKQLGRGDLHLANRRKPIRRVYNECGTFSDMKFPDSHHYLMTAETFPSP